MHRRATLILIAITVAAMISPATAEIYKWTDTLGDVHYGDQPPFDEEVEQLHIKDENLELSPMLMPKEKPESEGSPSTSQLIVVPEESYQTEYEASGYRCFDPYKEDLSSDDVQASYASHTLSDEDISHLTLLFKTLDRNWRGEVVEIECFGTIIKPREEREYFTTRISGQWSMTGQLELEINYHNREKTSRQHYYWWLVEDSKLYFGDRRDIRAALKWVIDLDSISPEKLAFRKKIYRPNVKQIQVKEVAVISRSLYMTELLYTNGLLTAMYYWGLN